MEDWPVVANSSKVRVRDEATQVCGYVQVTDRVHPQNQQKGRELAGDRPGHGPGVVAHGTVSSAFDPHTDARKREHNHYASEVAAVLDEGITTGRCAGLVHAPRPPA